MGLVYSFGAKLLLEGLIDWESADIGILLVGDQYNLNRNHLTVSSIFGELEDPAYERKTLSGKSVVVDDTNLEIQCLADDPVWTELDSFVYGAIVYHVDGADETSSLLTFHDINFQSAADDLIISWPLSGVFTVRV